MKLFELLPFVDLPGQRSLTIAPPIDLLVKQALARLERRPSRQWLDAVRDLETGGPVRLEVSLEELALLLERVDFSSSRLEDIEAMKFWSHLEASCELLEALGHEWTNHLGFDCHESFSLVWRVPEGMVGYLAWLARCARPVPALPEELRYLNPRSKLAEVAARLLNTLASFSDCPTFVVWNCHPSPGQPACRDPRWPAPCRSGSKFNRPSRRCLGGSASTCHYAADVMFRLKPI